MVETIVRMFGHRARVLHGTGKEGVAEKTAQSSDP